LSEVRLSSFAPSQFCKPSEQETSGERRADSRRKLEDSLIEEATITAPNDHAGT
jgi:hypothetical protein